METSYWQRDAGWQTRREASLPTRVDVAVVGGGYAGLTTAIRIRERAPSTSVIVVEAERVGSGASGRNAGFLSPLAAPVWLLGSTEHAWSAAQINREVHAIARWIGSLDNCELASATLAMRGTNRLWDGSVRELAGAVARVGLDHRRADSTTQPGRAVLAMNAYTMHPAKLINALAARAEQLGVTIHEGVRATAIDGARMRVAGTLVPTTTIEAGTIVVCTNGYTGGLDVGERVRALTVHSFLAASALLDRTPPSDGDLTIEVAGLYQPYHRMHGRRLIFGGVDRVRAARIDDVRRELADAMAIRVPGATIATVWGGAFHATTTGLPIVRRSMTNPVVVLNVGYGGTGVALSLICARLAAALAIGEPAGDDARLLAAISDTRVPMRGSLRAIAGIAARFAQPWR